MPRLADKWLRLVLALVLATLPFAQALGERLHSMPVGAHHGEAMAQSGHMLHSGSGKLCNGCDTSHGYHCDGGHCHTCAATLLHAPLVVGSMRLSSPVPLEPVTALTDHPSGLFRPPRA